MIICILEYPIIDDSAQVWFADTEKFDLNDPVHVAYKKAIDKALADTEFHHGVLNDYDAARFYGGDSLNRVAVEPPVNIDAQITIWLESY